jgi:fibronectin type 3 domain-containing protein
VTWRRARRAGAGLGSVLLILAAGVGCGKKGLPVAPERRLPAAATALAAAVEGPGIDLHWVNPDRRVDGSPLRDLAVINVFRRAEEPGADVKPAMLARGRVVGYDRIATIRLDAPAPATVDRTAVRIADRQDLVYGRRYVYVVTAVDATGRSSAPSPRAIVVFLAAPGPPRDLAAVAGDRQVQLSWRPPEALIDGQPAADPMRYVVLRAAGDAPLATVTAAPIATTSFTDPGVANDVDYRYAVAAVRVDPAGQARGAASPPVSASPARTTPPAAPTGLVAIPAAGSVRLAWNEVKDPEVATYAIYRAEQTGAFTRIGTTPAGSSVFIDRPLAAGRTFRYAVTAIDRARRPNESPQSNEVTVTAE